MNICHVVTGLSVGTEVIVRQLAAMQVKAEHRVTVLYSATHGGLSGKQTEGVDFVQWDAGRAIDPMRDFQMLLQLVSRLQSIAPDVVHLHNAKAGALGRLACRWL